jgi:hypothetical protein
MPKRPRLRVVKEDPPLIATNRVIVIIGSSRYALDISTRCAKLKPSRAEVIPINRQLKGTRTLYFQITLKSGHLRSSGIIWFTNSSYRGARFVCFPHWLACRLVRSAANYDRAAQRGCGPLPNSPSGRALFQRGRHRGRLAPKRRAILLRKLQTHLRGGNRFCRTRSEPGGGRIRERREPVLRVLIRIAQDFCLAEKNSRHIMPEVDGKLPLAVVRRFADGSVSQSELIRWHPVIVQITAAANLTDDP